MTRKYPRYKIFPNFKIKSEQDEKNLMQTYNANVNALK